MVDAHPSPSKSRPEILDIIGDRVLHFVCLTHPHADHGVDLVPVLRAAKRTEEFWHTISEIIPFVYRLGEAVNYPSPKAINFPSSLGVWARKMAEDWANFHIDIFGAVAERAIPQRRLRAGLEPVTIDGVDVHILSPEENIHDRFFKYWMEKAGDPRVEPPDRNALSAILALRFGDSVVLLGADALQENWTAAAKRYRKHGLSKAIVLKVPHHGARNAIDLRTHSKTPTYLDLCRHDSVMKCHAVLFAGDSRHPNSTVQEKLRARTCLFCLSNGISSAPSPGNPLGIDMEGARAVRRTIPVCNPVVSFELSRAGGMKVLAGVGCDGCSRVNL